MSEFDRSSRHPAEDGDPSSLRTRLIEAAQVIVLSKGLPDLTLRHLALAADVDVWAVLREFRTKEDLFSALRDRRMV